MPEKCLGLDGCRAGWVATDISGKTPTYKILSTDEEVEQALLEYDRIFIDIPVGLEDEVYTRECDRLLRQELGKEYASSVFDAPIRPAAEAPSYSVASMLSFDYTEKKISMQSWNITPKIVQIDKLLQKHPELIDKVYESHPELLFRILNGGYQIEQKKSTSLGLKHRLALLGRHLKGVKDLYREVKESEHSRDMKEDDLLDSLCLTLFAKFSYEHPILTLPEEPKKDANGIPMRVAYIDLPVSDSWKPVR